VEKLVAALGPEELYRINPNIATANYSYPKLAWLRDEKPDLYNKTEKFLLFGELLFNLLGIEAETSFSHANRTLLFDINKEDWSDTLLEHTGIPRSKLPPSLVAAQYQESFQQTLLPS